MGCPCKRDSFAIAAARCVLPEPTGPESTNQPSGSCAYSVAACVASLYLLWKSGSDECFAKFNESKVSRVRGPRLLYFCSLASRSSLLNCAWQEHGTAFPKSGCPTWTLVRTHPFPSQVEHSFGECSTYLRSAERSVSTEVLLRVSRFRISARLSIPPAFFCPSF